MTEQPDLKPCPWCREKTYVEVFNGSYKTWWVWCDSGWHTVMGPERKTEAGAIKAWNERSPR